MKIDLSKLKEIASCLPINKEIVLTDLFLDDEITTPDPFLLNLEICLTKDSFVLTGNLSGHLVLSCSRCLKEFKYKLDISITEELLKKDIQDLSKVDLKPIFRENIILNIPIKLICSDDCQGLCSQCGTNLNLKKCECKEDNIDPRLAKLQDFFK